MPYTVYGFWFSVSCKKLRRKEPLANPLLYGIVILSEAKNLVFSGG
jgi:hypothetical protein